MYMAVALLVWVAWIINTPGLRQLAERFKTYKGESLLEARLF